jgi:hypothetical protein
LDPIDGGLLESLRSFKFLDKGSDVVGDWLFRVDVRLMGGKEALDYLSWRINSRLTVVANLTRLKLIMSDVTLNDWIVVTISYLMAKPVKWLVPLLTALVPLAAFGWM